MRPVVHVVGGGPGDPELLTLKGARLLKEARFVLYTGSLFPEGALRELAPKAELLDSKGLVLEGIAARLAEEARRGGVVVRLHSGDPSLYGTLLEEREALEALGVEVRVVPGVTAAFALAARLALPLTVPEVAQAVAFTRLGVRTPVPEGQGPGALARPGLTLALYLSGMHPKRLRRELLEAGLPPETPVAFGHRVGQEGEEVGLLPLEELGGLPPRDTTVFLVGEALGRKGLRSRLYDPSFRHKYRR
ncbi:MAG: cobalt-precorrin-4/precorrin-4 C(11)-methyltransferase [Thermus sp.]|uniref:cobalt-precorrin-4/precorrin-4 C(11)-methyltransferase n=1 Tax=Thermus sp. TaxID=275 RepID=UPI0025E21F98|nr:cobalt-precorrin-4/precorrin-4 C(11)-methyltransferase [Thermus sp.]MCS7219310.1 cobalt-precorrin-4/precorrin-4 C(11)-methyltransferase [Thermus sp.]MDW8018320.1 cobalt-precorrin-4/precorrin-4 C(11)-methyltransferase [Thermus sp.]